MTKNTSLRRGLLTGSSLVALISASAYTPAEAACVLVTGASSGFTNPNGTTIDCITVNNGTVTGNIVNAGNITPGGTAGGISIQVNSTINGAVINTGTITATGAAQDGIISSFSTITGGISNAGTISAGQIGMSLFATPTFAGGIANSGSITAREGIGIASVLTFTGGISNSGTISATVSNGILVGGSALQGATIAGGIANSGRITAAQTGILIFDPGSQIATFSGGISNSGTITATANGIELLNLTSFLGGITNNGSISGATAILVSGGRTFTGGIVSTGTLGGSLNGLQVTGVSNFSGGITVNSVTATADDGVFVNHVTTFAGGITSTGVINAGHNGIHVDAGSVTIFNGDIVNRGNITAGAGFAGIAINAAANPPLTLTGNIINTGTITASGGGSAINLATAGVINGGISNSGSLTAPGGFGVIGGGAVKFGTNALGIVNSGTISGGVVAAVFFSNILSTFLGGISNSGVIASTLGNGILVTATSTFSGGISNGGTISGLAGIRIVAPTFTGAITNTGNITGTGGTAIDLAVGNAVTIDQQGGTITGAIVMSTNGDTLNVTGGAINGNVTGNSLGHVNFALGAGTFTYANPFIMGGLADANFNSGTVFVDGQVNATAVNINSGAIVGGTGALGGAVVVNSGATLKPGNAATPLGTLTVNGGGTFNAGSFYAVQVTPSANSSTFITGAPGTATINGGTVQVTLNQLGSFNHTYTIVTADGGRTGTFSGLAFTGGFSGSSSLSYDGMHVFLTLNGVSLLGPGSGGGGAGGTAVNFTINQQNVLNGINNAILGGASIPTQFQNLVGLTGAQLANALTQFSGENHAGFFQGAFQGGGSFLNMMVNPFLDGRFGNGGGFGAAMGFAAEEPPALPQAAAAFASAMPVKAPVPATFEQRFSIWGGAYGGSGRVNGDAAVLGSHDTSATAAAFAAGIDYRLSPNTIVGFALAGGGTSWNVTGGLGSGHSDMFQAGVYGSHRWGAAYISGAVAYNFHDVTTNRTVTVAGTDMLQARFDANGIGARLEGGYRYATPWLGFTPYAAAQVQSIALPNYSETATAGSNQFALNFASQTATTERTELGAWLDKKMLMDNGALLTLYGRAAWAHDFGNNPHASAIFQTLPGSNFIVNGAVPARDGALVTGAAQVSLASGWAFLAKFDGEFSSTTSVYTGSGMVKKTW